MLSSAKDQALYDFLKFNPKNKYWKMVNNYDYDMIALVEQLNAIIDEPEIEIATTSVCK